MKTKIFKLLFCCVALLTFTLQSCSNKEEEIFEESPSVRLQALMDKTQATLVSSENGWVMDYFPDRDLSYGGFLYILKFNKQSVEAYCELSDDLSESIESLYKLSNDDGAVLSFDSYNEFLHFFATPSSGRYEAYDGDFEFKIMKVEDDLITLKGKRSGNAIYLHRLKEEPVQYLEKCVKTSESIFISDLSGSYGGQSASAYLDFDVRYLEIEAGGAAGGQYYLPTPTGIRFVEPLELNGANLETLDFNDTELVFTGKDSNGKDITLSGVLPEDYVFEKEIEGAWTLTFGSPAQDLDVQLVKVGNGEYAMKGLNPKFDPIIKYRKTLGCLEMNSQAVGANGSNVVWLCAWDTNAGSLTWSEEAGMYIKKDVKESDESTLTMKWVDSGRYDGLSMTSFLLWQLTSAGANAGAFTNSSWYFTGTATNRFLFPTKMVKK